MNITDYGASPSASAAANTLAIQHAIDDAAALGKDVRVPAGTYLVTPATPMTDETGSVHTCFVMRSNMHIVAEKGATFKIENGISSAGAPFQMRMFLTIEVLSNVSFSGLTLDMNGANNRISAPGGPYTRLNQAHIWVSGTTAGVAARIDDVTITGCRFLNSPGTTSIAMAQSNSLNTVLGKRWKLLNNYFANNGFDTDDHSTVFGWAEDVVCEGNEFVGVGHALSVSNSVAYEVHGSRTRFVVNNIRAYYQGLWIATNYTSAVDGTIVSNNQMTDIFGVGIDFFRSTANEEAITNTLIADNYIELNNSAPALAISLKVGVQIASFYTIDGVTVKDNVIVKSGTALASAAGVVFTQSVVGQTHTNITFDGNRSRATTFGIYLGTTATNGIGTIVVTNNEFVDLTPTGTFPNATGTSFSVAGQPIASLTVAGNKNIGGQYGTYLTGVIAQLNYRANEHRNTVVDLAEVGLTVTTRNGEFVAIPYTPTVACGGAGITLGDGTLVGSYDIANSKMSVRATLTVGSTTVLPTGTITFSLPSVSEAGATYLGNYRVVDVSASLFYSGVADIDGTGSVAHMLISGGFYVSKTLPIVLAAGDTIALDVTYVSG